jgi:hypothetical protein
VAVLLPEPLGVEAGRLMRERTQLGLFVATRAVRHRQQ